jgi:hypothetical protein
MPIDEKDVEKYLGEFRTRAVRPLEIMRPKVPAWAGRLAAAAVLAVLAGGGAWFLAHSRKAQSGAKQMVEQKKEKTPGEAGQKLPMLQLTKLAVEDPERLDALLGEAPKRNLLVLDGKKSMLGTLAKE